MFRLKSYANFREHRAVAVGSILSLLVLSSSGCALQFAVKAGGLEVAYLGTAIDPRVGEKHVETDTLELNAYKDPVSEQAAAAAEKIVPELAAAIVKALIAKGALGALGGLGELTGSEDAPGATIEVGDDPE